MFPSMIKPRKQRVRDPVHGLVVFETEGPDARRDQAAWDLLNTPEFQRLRRILQLALEAREELRNCGVSPLIAGGLHAT